MIRNFRVVFVILLSLLLISCKSELQPPAAPSNFTVTPISGGAVLTWDQDPDLIYSVYYQVGPTVSLDNYINFATRISSPFTVSGLANQTQYAFILNASNHGSVPGPSTPVVTVTPGDSGAGTAWTVGSALTSSPMRGVAFGSNNFVAVGDATTVFVATQNDSSSSGIGTWTQPVGGVPLGGGVNIPSVVFTGITFVAMAADGSIITSPDTVAWTLKTDIGVPAGTQMTSLAYGNSSYVAVGFGGTIRTTTDGSLTTTWTPRTSGTSNDLYGVSYVGGMFVAVGNAGTLLTSTDGGVTWTSQVSDTPNNLYQVAYDGANTFVAIGDAGTIITSPNGTNWALQSAPTAKNLYSIAYGAGPKFVVSGAGGLILYSTLGSEGTWVETNAGTVDLYSVAAGSVYVAVGSGGANVSGR